MSQQVPLVIYKRGVRTVVGMALVENNGTIIAQVAKDHVKDVEKFFLPSLGELALTPRDA